MKYDIRFANCKHVAAFFDSTIEWYLGELDINDIILVVTSFMETHNFTQADIINTDTEEIIMTISESD